jgi:hypothetical protein
MIDRIEVHEHHGEKSASANGGSSSAGPAAQVLSPIFILAPPRSFTSVACAMLGQHPQLYGLSELQLFPARSVAHWWRLCSGASFNMQDGLLRTVGELFFGGQTDYTIECARGWLRRRGHLTTGMILEEIALRVHPRITVEKSPSIVYRLEYLNRAFAMFPQARFIHLTRHPVAQGESVLKAIAEAEKFGAVPYWLLNLASYPYWPKSQGPESVLDLDPQRGWYELNMNICEFLKRVPEAQQMRVRGEDWLNEPERVLAEVAAWLGLRTDAEAVEAMKHPEQSPYARFGPPNAPMGNDGFFLANPLLRPERAQGKSLEGPLSWRSDGRELSPRVKILAQQFGYS